MARHLALAAVVLAGLAPVAGCESMRAARENILPTQLSMLVEDSSGTPISLVMDLRRNIRSQLDVRVSEGMRLFDGRHLWEFRSRHANVGWRIDLVDMLEDRPPRELPLLSSDQPQIVEIERNSVWFETSGGLIHCSLQQAMCEPAESASPRTLSESGPRGGFKVWLTPTGDLRLSLPHDADDSGQIILNGVTRIIGTHWVRGEFVERDNFLDRTFRGRASLVAVPRDVLVDGDLGEWTQSDPLVIEAPWQIQSGAEHWDGPRDASFSITASRAGERVCFAGRVRDDDGEPGDVISVDFGSQVLDVPVGAPGPTSGGFVSHDWFGVHFEACESEQPQRDGQLPFVASFADVDGDGTKTVLSSAPLGETATSGTIRVDP